MARRACLSQPPRSSPPHPRRRGQDITVPLNPRDPAAGAGPLAQRVYDELLAIQYGRVPGHPWTLPVPPPSK